MIQILFDICMPKSCSECQFIVHCDECESWENYCPLLHERVGYDYNEPYTPKDHRRENCPLKEVEERPHGECKTCKHYVPYREQFSYRHRGDGYCKSAITTSEGEAYINCHDEWYCANYEKEGEAE